ncbi:MAG: EamA family transporter [Candidatus Paceibacterota bacterium]|jgi:drug/metabolite transporter (DMT)-like permease
MNWFFIAILAPIFWSINTHFDKFILSKYSKGRSVGSVFLFSTLFSIFILIAIFIFKYKEIILYSSFRNFLLFLIPGVFSALGLYFYLQSLKNEESSVVVALYQTSPVFAYLLGYIFLGEVLTLTQVLASLIILIGVGILSFDLEKIEGKLSVKWKMVSFILLSALFFAFNDVLFKKFTIFQGSFVTSFFWQHLGIFIVGLSFFLFYKDLREDFFSLVKKNHVKIFVLNGFSEFFYTLGNFLSNLATLFAPVVLVLVVNTYQTVFTFIIGISLTLFLPHIITEKISKRHLAHRILAIFIILIGSYFLYLN